MLYPKALELTRAVDSLRRYCALQPGNHFARYQLGSLLYKLARLDDAEQELNEAIRLAPTAGIYHFALSQAYFRRTPSPEITERVRVELQLALDNGTPEPATTYYYLGLYSQRKGDWNGARSALETSVKLAPNASGAYYTMAEVLGKLGRLDDARKARQRFAALRAKEDARMK